METNHNDGNYLLDNYGIDFTNIENAIILLSEKINDDLFIQDKTAILNTVNEIFNIYLLHNKDDIIDNIIIQLINISNTILNLNYIDIELKKQLLQSINEIVIINYDKHTHNCEFISNYINMVISVLNGYYYNTEELLNISNLIIEIIDYSKEIFKNDYLFTKNSIYAINHILNFNQNQLTTQIKQKVINAVMVLTDNNIYIKENDHILAKTAIGLVYNVLCIDNNIDIDIVKRLINNISHAILNLNYNTIEDNTKIIIIKLFQFIINYDLIQDINNFTQLINNFIQQTNKKSNNSDYITNFIYLVNIIMNKQTSNTNNKKYLSQIAIELFIKNYDSLKDNEFFYCNLIKFTKNLVLSELLDTNHIVDLIKINLDLVFNKYNTFPEYCEFQSDCIELIINILKNSNNKSVLNQEIIIHIINNAITNYNKLFNNIQFKYKFIDLLNIVLLKANNINLIKYIGEIGIKFVCDNTNTINEFEYNSDFILRLLKLNRILINKNNLLKKSQNKIMQQELIKNEIKLLTHIAIYNSITDYNNAPFLMYVLNNVIINNTNINNAELLIQFGNKIIIDNQYSLNDNNLFVIDAINFAIIKIIKFKINPSTKLMIATNNLIISNIDKLKSNNTFLNNSIYFINIALKQRHESMFTRENMLNSLIKLITYAISGDNDYKLDKSNKRNIINLLFEIFNKKNNINITNDLINYGINNTIENLIKFNENINTIPNLLKLSSAIINTISNNIDKFQYYPVFLINCFAKNYGSYKDDPIIINNVFKLILDISNSKLNKIFKVNLYDFAIDFMVSSNDKLIFNDYNLINNTFMLINSALQHRNKSKNKYKLANQSIILIKKFLDEFANISTNFDLVSLLISTIKNSIPFKEINSLELLKQQENKLIKLKLGNTQHSNTNTTLQLMSQVFEKAGVDMEKNMQPVRRRNENAINEEQYINERRTEIINGNNQQFQNTIKKSYINSDKSDIKLFKK